MRLIRYRVTGKKSGILCFFDVELNNKLIIKNIGMAMRRGKSVFYPPCVFKGTNIISYVSFENNRGLWEDIKRTIKRDYLKNQRALMNGKKDQQ